MTLLVIHEKNEPQTENPLRGVPYPLTKDLLVPDMKAVGRRLQDKRTVGEMIHSGSQGSGAAYVTRTRDPIITNCFSQLFQMVIRNFMALDSIGQVFGSTPLSLVGR